MLSIAPWVRPRRIPLASSLQCQPVRQKPVRQKTRRQNGSGARCEPTGGDKTAPVPDPSRRACQDGSGSRSNLNGVARRIQHRSNSTSDGKTDLVPDPTRRTVADAIRRPIQMDEKRQDGSGTRSDSVRCAKTDPAFGPSGAAPARRIRCPIQVGQRGKKNPALDPIRRAAATRIRCPIQIARPRQTRLDGARFMPTGIAASRRDSV